MKRIACLDHMIDDNIAKYHCAPWSYSPINEHYHEMQSVRGGQVNYRGHIFVVTHLPGRRGLGGMDDGSPESVNIIKIDVPSGEDIK